ncbi:hypothetical protein B9Z55_027060 [Caenorhabditis nigoni]|uniref:Uncharacterized protein n=1 Tax=Caenorhabditis nigoni TaxID=1611254 RepID=A0A2G5SJ13_9PELO|nr:hypothetical protein B9Z55_027060 [Caenorhabditis nigoni]
MVVSKSENHYFQLYSTQIAVLLALSALIQPISGVLTMKIVLGGPNDSCAKYTKKGHEFLKISHARIMQQENNMVVGNMLCTPKTFDETKLTYTLICDGVLVSQVSSGIFFGN